VKIMRKFSDACGCVKAEGPRKGKTMEIYTEKFVECFELESNSLARQWKIV
jgi:hypothetical protein